MVRNISEYLQKDPRIDEWLNMHVETYIKTKTLTRNQLSHVIDYFKSTDSPRRIIRVGVDEAIRQSEAWTIKLNKKYKEFKTNEGDDVSLHKTYDNGYFWVKLEKSPAYDREGALMGHCVASYASHKRSIIYSLRDAQNMPHCTLEVTLPEQEINQIKGKKNESIVEKYHPYVIDFIKTSKLKFSTYDLSNLNAFKVIREGKEEIVSLKEVKSGDRFISSVDYHKVKDLSLDLSFSKLQSYYDFDGSIVIDPKWAIEELHLAGKMVRGKDLKCKVIVMKDSDLLFDSITADKVRAHECAIVAKEIKIKDLFMEVGYIEYQTLESGDASFRSVNVKGKKTRVDYFTLENPGRTNVTSLFKDLVVTTYLKLEGAFGPKFSLPALKIKTLWITTTDIKVYPKHCSCETLFVNDKTKLEGAYEELFS